MRRFTATSTKSGLLRSWAFLYESSSLLRESAGDRQQIPALMVQAGVPIDVLVEDDVLGVTALLRCVDGRTYPLGFAQIALCEVVL